VIEAIDDRTPPRARMTREGRRALLLAVGRRRFAERGYHGTSVGDIAREACCSEAVLYQHFAGKLELFTAVLEDQAARLRSRLDAAAVADRDDPFAGIARALGERIQEPDVPDALKLRSLAVTMGDEPPVRRTLDRIRQGFVEVVGGAVRASQAHGRLRADVDPEHVVGLLAGLSFLGAFQCAVAGDDELRRLAPVAETLLHVLANDPADQRGDP
jgi:AcrR family transcriptional regulator